MSSLLKQPQPRSKKRIFNRLAIRVSPWFSYAVGFMCRSGKRTLSENLLSEALFSFGVRRRGTLTPYNVLSMRYFKLRPRLTYKSLRIAGQVQYIPCPITAERQKYLAFKWFFDSASRRSENGFSLRIKSELLDILRGRGESIRRRRDHYAIVRANRALLTNRNFYELQVETRCHV